MKRDYTLTIRYILDELIPPIIRDSRWFIAPFYMLAYRTFSVKKMMDFKKKAYSMSAEEYADYYKNLEHSISRRRETDLNTGCVKWIQASIPEGIDSIADIGCGGGFLLRIIQKKHPSLHLTGVDVSLPTEGVGETEFKQGLLPHLPFSDETFDIVMCTHVLEHVVDLKASVDELLRITKSKVLIVIPRQRYYTYSLDEHLHFFPNIEPLLYLFKDHTTKAQLIDGDWAVEVIKDQIFKNE